MNSAIPDPNNLQQQKGKEKIGDIEINSTWGGINWGKVKALPKFQISYDPDKDFGVGDYSPLTDAILAKPFPPKFKLSL